MQKVKTVKLVNRDESRLEIEFWDDGDVLITAENSSGGAEVVFNEDEVMSLIRVLSQGLEEALGQ